MLTLGNRRNHYRTLHVQPEAPLEVIKASYRALMMRMRLHPDLGGDHETAALVNEAYAVLSDPQRRAAYDRLLRMRVRPELMRLDAAPPVHESGVPEAAQAGAAAGAPSAEPMPAEYTAHRHGPLMRQASRLRCAFCMADNRPSGAAHAALCSRCGAPLTPVHPLIMPNFRGVGLNRRQSVRRPRQTEAVAYWGLPPQRYRVLWRDLSAGGLSVLANQPLSPGSRLQILDPDIHAVAEIVGCQPAPSGWLLRARLLTMRPLKRSGLFCSTQA